MIYIIEIPHQRQPKCWAVHTEQQAIDAINEGARRCGEHFETLDGALKYNGSDLSSQIVCSNDSGALACLADDDMWQRHGGFEAREALRDKIIRHGLLPTPPIMYEIVRNSTGLLDGRKPVSTEFEARAIATRLAQEQGEAFQIWDKTRLIDVVSPGDSPNNH